MRASTLLGAVAVTALVAAAAHAKPGDPIAAAAPDPLYNPPAVGDRDFSTGAIANPAAIPAPADAAPAATPSAETAPVADAPAAQPAPVVAADLAPLPAAVMATLADTTFKLSQADREALTTFYAARQGAPFWISNDRFTQKAADAKARIAKAAEDGLVASAFKLPADVMTTAPADVARAEIQMSLAALSYGRQAWGGRIVPKSISPMVTAEPSPFDAQAALGSIEQSHDVAATLDGFNPQHPQFQELRKLLASARRDRGADAPEQPRIAAGKLLEPGGEDPRVPALRKRLGLSSSPDDLFYDAELEDAVIAFQKKNKIGASGLVNKVTIRALNAGSHPKSDADLIEMNMERWRWMPRELGEKHVFVDIPVFRLHIMQGGTSTYDTRVIVGKKTNQTPVFSDEIDHIVVNPYWNVPSTIALKEMQGSSLRGFEVVDSRGRKVENFSWEDVKANRVRIRQPPGERNALGHIKFMFPNKHAVYLHDTSSRSLFDRSARAMSHGCVRVDRPLEFADALSGDQGLSGAKLKSMIGGKERYLGLSTKIPVHLTYFTAWVDPNGKLETRDDLYGLDMRLRAALRGEPLPPLPKDEAPKVIAKVAKPKPKPQPVETVASAAPPPAERPSVNWIHRLFGGDSR